MFGLFAVAALVFQQKLCLPENVLSTLLNDRLVAKGTVLEFITTFFQVGVTLQLVTSLLFASLLSHFQQAAHLLHTW